MMDVCVGGVLFSVVASRCLGGGLSFVLMVCIVCVLAWVWKSPRSTIRAFGYVCFILFMLCV